MTPQKKETFNLANDIDTATTVLASQIKQIAEAGRSIKRSALNDKAVTWLVARAAGVGVGETKAVLRALPNLEKVYLK